MMVLPMRTPKKSIVKKFRFLGEQDGRPERMLKGKLSELFAFGGDIENAYLARVDFGNSVETSVALCLRTRSGSQQEVVNYVGAAFSGLFNAKEHLDVIFLNEEEEAQLKRVCRPFFIRGSVLRPTELQ
ncbi:MAG TPA: enhanced serine sensitivity protein SseB C-terminal domain-containing protein [Stellaceae bacterium]|nr:enhanced serine sensitivity protein SseB C-terminal domain-containing protein [Stellaceae bacterium]